MLMKGNYRKNRSIAISWLFSYILVLLVPILISSLIYIEANNVLYKEVTRANQSLLAEIQYIIDGSLKDMERISAEICFNDNVNAFLNANDLSNTNGITSYDIVRLSRVLRLFGFGNAAIDDMYIHHKNSGTFLGMSARLTQKTFYDTYVRYSGKSVSEYEGFLTGGQYQDTLTLHGQNPNTSFILFRFPVLHRYGMPSDSDIIFVVNESMFFRTAQEKMYILEADIKILNSNNEIVTTTNYGMDYSFIDYAALLNNDGLMHVKNNNEEYVVMHTSSHSHEWKYLMIVNVKVFWEKVRYLRLIMQAGLGLCIVIGGLVSYLFMKKNYGVISNLVNSIAQKAGIGIDSSNEIQFIQDVFNKTIGEKEEATVYMEKQSKNMRDVFLNKLLKGKIEEGVSSEDALSVYNIMSGAGGFAVLLIYVEDYSKFTQEDNAVDSFKEFRLIQFIITNIMEEITNRSNEGYVCEIDGMMACIVSFRDNRNKENTEELIRIAKESQHIIGEHFSIYLSVSISNIHQSLYGAAVAYQEAIETMEYKMVFGIGKVLEYSTISREYSGAQYHYYYPLQLEYQLINCVKAADTNAARLIVSEVFSKNFSENALSVKLAKCLVFNIISTMIKAINEIGEEDIDPIQRIEKCSTTDQMKQEIIAIIEDTCAYVDKNKQSAMNNLYLEIEKYIKENYSDFTLSISKIGEYFHMTPSYISKLYKEQAGGGLLDYISRTRIEAAKKLWETEKCTIQEAAVQVGYNDIKTFIRAFKKLEGITPGKFKETHGKSL